jgi:hypothetical protein
VVLDEGHTTTRSGAVKPDGEAAADPYDDDRGVARGDDVRDDRAVASDTTARDDRAAAAELPLTRDRAIEDERHADADARTTDHDRDGVDDRTERDHFGDVDRTTVAPTPGRRDRGLAADDDRMDTDRPVDDDRATGPHGHAPILETAALETMRERQRDRFGGIHWGSDFFGWLCAIGLASLLTAILVGAGVALGLSTTDAQNPGSAQTIGLGGGIALLVVLAVSWFCGGYVAGRMARFDGARQGIGVWLWTILAAIVVAALAAIGGSEYDVFQRLNLPSIAIGDNTLTAGGAITGAIAIVVTLLFAVIGGKAGERYHKRVDRVATDEFVVER